MGLLAECKFCHHFFSARRLDDHIRSQHSAAARSEKRRPSGAFNAPLKSNSPQKTTAVLNDRKSPVLFAANGDATHPAPWGGLPSPDPRVIRARLEQQARCKAQDAKNQTTDAFVKKSTLKNLNIVPLSSVWKEQVAKLAKLTSKQDNEQSYTFHLQQVPVRQTLPRVRKDSSKLKMNKGEQGATMSSPDRLAKPTTTPCSCGGENENCYRCFGVGYYKASVAALARRVTTATSLGARGGTGPASFASDGRGGANGLRELGRFISLPAHDDYGEESSS